MEIRAKMQAAGHAEVSFASYRVTSRAVFTELSVHVGIAFLG
jgi:hypothetical protein